MAPDAAEGRNLRGNTKALVNAGVNRSQNVNVNHRHGWDHPVGLAVTAAVVGFIFYSLPPFCSVVGRDNPIYHQCSSTWYKPQCVGDSAQYAGRYPTD